MNRIMIAAVLVLAAGLVRAGDADKGKETYGASCASCHGKDGKGNPSMGKVFKVDAAALDLTDKETLDKKDEDLAAVTNGGKGKMPAYKDKLKGDAVADTIAYVRTLAAAPKAEAKAEGKKAGGAGEALYNGKCASCHGKDGKGSPNMAKVFKLDVAKLDLTSEDVAKDKDEELAGVVSKGKGKMPSFAGKLKDAEIADIIAYFRTLKK